MLIHRPARPASRSSKGFFIFQRWKMTTKETADALGVSESTIQRRFPRYAKISNSDCKGDIQMNEKEMAACWATLRKALEDGKNDPITIISECCTGFLFVMDGVERRISEMSKAVNNG